MNFFAKRFHRRMLYTDSIIVTKSCINKINELRAMQNNPKLKLRIFVDSGGCSGFQYEFKLDDDQQSTDNLIGSEVIVDELSLEFIKGSTIDYKMEMIQSSFAVTNNPQSESACGCGSSFALKSFGKDSN